MHIILGIKKFLLDKVMGGRYLNSEEINPDPIC